MLGNREKEGKEGCWLNVGKETKKLHDPKKIKRGDCK